MLKGKLSARCNPTELVNTDCFWRPSWVDHHVTLLVLLFYLIAVIVSIMLPHKFGTSYELRWFANIETNTIGTIWQVQTMFLSFGYAALAIAIQVFSYGSVSIGVSRKQLLKTIKADRFAISGLVANGVLAIKTTLKTVPIDSLICLAWLLLTISFLVNSTWKLLKLYSTPAAVDFLARETLKQSIIIRGNDQFEKQQRPINELQKLNVHTETNFVWESRKHNLKIPAPIPGRVIRSYNYREIANIPSVLNETSKSIIKKDAGEEQPREPIVILHRLPGERTELNSSLVTIKTDYRVTSHQQNAIVEALQRAVRYESADAVTADEEIELEATKLYDAISTGLTSGAFATAERAIKILWSIAYEISNTYDKSSTKSSPENDFLLDKIFHQLAHAEKHCIVSPQAADFFIRHTINNLNLSRTLSQKYYTHVCVQSLLRIWSDIVSHSTGERYKPSQFYALISLHSLTLSSKNDDDQQLTLQIVWALAEMTKRSLDAKHVQAATRCATALNKYFSEHTSNEEIIKNVSAAKLVLLSWKNYLKGTKDPRYIESNDLTKNIQLDDDIPSLLDAMKLLEDDNIAFRGWKHWELKAQIGIVAQPLEFTSYIDKTLLECILDSYGSFPPIENNSTANLYSRMRTLLDDDKFKTYEHYKQIRTELETELKNWRAKEMKRLANTPLSADSINELRDNIASALEREPRLSNRLPIIECIPPMKFHGTEILNYTDETSRQLLVPGVFDRTAYFSNLYCDGVAEQIHFGEESRIVNALLNLTGTHHVFSIESVSNHIDMLGNEASYFVLLTPYSISRVMLWEHSKFLERVSHFRLRCLTKSAILFDSRDTLFLYRSPEKRKGFTPVGVTDVALRVYEDVDWEFEPQIRIEVSEYFVLEAGNDPSIHFFDIVSDEQ